MIRVFIGTDSSIHQKAEKVVEYSIRKNTIHDVDIQFIRPGWKSGVTGFTTHRFLIPELCNYQGFAIYLDVDMLVLGDIKELWDYQTPGKWCTTKLRDDVSVIDCEAFKDIPKRKKLKPLKKEQLKKFIGSARLENIPITWNHRGNPVSDTKLIHFTHLRSQPWKPSPKIKYVPYPHKEAENLFFKYLKEAEELK